MIGEVDAFSGKRHGREPFQAYNCMYRKHPSRIASPRKNEYNSHGDDKMTLFIFNTVVCPIFQRKHKTTGTATFRGVFSVRLEQVLPSAVERLTLADSWQLPAFSKHPVIALLETVLLLCLQYVYIHTA